MLLALFLLWSDWTTECPGDWMSGATMNDLIKISLFICSLFHNESVNTMFVHCCLSAEQNGTGQNNRNLIMEENRNCYLKRYMMAPMRVIDVRAILKFYYISHITLSLYDIMVFFICCLPTALSYVHISYSPIYVDAAACWWCCCSCSYYYYYNITEWKRNGGK